MSEKITNIIEAVKGLTVLELADLVKAIEEEFGVSAAAPVMMAGPVAGGAAAAEAASAGEVLPPGPLRRGRGRRHRGRASINTPSPPT